MGKLRFSARFPRTGAAAAGLREAWFRHGWRIDPLQLTTDEAEGGLGFCMVRCGGHDEIAS